MTSPLPLAQAPSRLVAASSRELTYEEETAPLSWLGAAVCALAGLAVVMRWSGPGFLQVGLALACLGLAGGVGVRLALLPRLLLAVAAGLVLRLALDAPPDGSAAARLSGLLRQLAYFALPPLLVHLLVVWRSRRGLLDFGLTAPLFYAPVGVAFVAVAGYEALVAPGSEGSALVRAAYGALYALPVVLLLLRELRTRTQRVEVAPAKRAVALEEQGRFGVAERYYAQSEQLDKAAEMAERAGEWSRAADLYRRAGENFRAAEMAFRAGRLELALELYEKDGAHAAAARVAEQLGRGAHAGRLYELAGDAPSAVRVLTAAGLKPAGDLLARAGRLEDAVVAWQEERQYARAAEALEQDFHDLEGAAQVYFNGGLYVSAAKLFERLDNTPAAIAAYLAAPDAQIDAARLCLAGGDVLRAGEILAALPSATLAALDDDASLLTVAAVEEETGQLEAAVRTLQRLRRRSDPPPAVFLPLGRCLHARGLTELAEENLRSAFELRLGGADELEAAYLLGCVLEERGKRAEAADIFLELMRRELGYRDVEDRYRRLGESTDALAS